MTNEYGTACRMALHRRRRGPVEPCADRHDLSRRRGMRGERVTSVAAVACSFGKLDAVVHHPATMRIEGIVSRCQQTGSKAVGYEVHGPIDDLPGSAAAPLDKPAGGHKIVERKPDVRARRS